MFRPMNAIAGTTIMLSGFLLLWLLVLALIDRDSPHARRSQWAYSQLARRPRLQIALATALIALLFAACEARGVVNVISGSPEDVAQAFLTDLSRDEGDYGWHLLHPELRDAVSQDAYRRAVAAAGVTPFRLDVLHVTRDEAYLLDRAPSETCSPANIHLSGGVSHKALSTARKSADRFHGHGASGPYLT